MGITRFGDHERASLGDAAERSQSGYLQSRYPLLSCNHSLKDITEDNLVHASYAGLGNRQERSSIIIFEVKK